MTSHKLIIAEKPNLARNIIAAIHGSKFKKFDGYYENADYIVTWAFGHLFSLLDIEEYKPKDLRTEDNSWTMEGLPFFPPSFRYGLRKDPRTHKVDPSTRKQFNIIKKLCARKDVDSIIHAGDADREGEIIIRIILDQANNKKPVMRLWMPDQTVETIQSGLRTLKSDSNYDNLANEGYARTQIDWIYGVNLTRYATLKSGSLLRTGRVIVPIVKAIYDRDMEIKKFQAEKYFSPASKETTKDTVIELTSKRRFAQKQHQEAINWCNKLNTAGAKVISVKTKEKIIKPGTLYSLSKLQGVLGKRFKMSPNDSLVIIQRLYEAGYVTYPRTNTEYLATAERDKTNRTLSMLREQGYMVSPKDQETTIYDDSKIEAHSAITPTCKLPQHSNLNEKDWQVYSTILNRFLAVFCLEPCVSAHTVIQIACGDLESFSLSGDVFVSRGWMEYDDPERSDKELPRLQEGELIHVNFRPVIRETQPPKRYTVDSLNKYLKNPFRAEKQHAADESAAITDADDLVTEQDVAQEYAAMFEGVELGTEATRTAIIENAIRSNYISLKNNIYSILPGGIFFIEALQKLGIQMDKHKTAALGRALKQVYRGELTIRESAALVYREVESVFQAGAEIKIAHSFIPGSEHASASASLGKCPKCGGEVIERQKLFGCSNRDCRFALWKNDYFLDSLGKTMTKTTAKQLLSEGQSKLTGCTSKKNGKKYDCILHADFTGTQPKFSISFLDKPN